MKELKAKVLGITGKRSYSESPEAMWWAHRAMLRALSHLSWGAHVHVGDAAGIDAMASDAVQALWSPYRNLLNNSALFPRPVGLSVYRKHGTLDVVLDDGTQRRTSWLPPGETGDLPNPKTPEEWKARLLLRDRVMIQALRRAGPDAVLLAFVHPWEALNPKLRTKGTEYTISQAGEAGVRVITLSCPVSCAPKQAPP